MGGYCMIKKLSVRNFGLFDELTINLNDGINIIIGENGYGKTTLVGAIKYIYYGKKAVKEYDKFDTESLVSSVVITDDKGNIFKRKSERQNLFLFSWETGVNASKELIEIIPENNKPTYPIFIHDDFGSDSNFDLEIITNLLVQTQLSLNSTKYFNRFISKIEKTNYQNHYKVSSYGEQYMLYLLNTLSKALSDRLEVVIIDGFGGALDSIAIDAIFELICSLQDRIQFIITLSPLNSDLLDEKVNCIYLEFENESQKSLKRLSTNYSFEPKYPVLDGDEIVVEEFIRYMQGDTVSLEENIETEFKEVKGNNPTSSILSLVDQYVVAFLNVLPKKIGRILWGITDSRSIVGVKLTYDDRDKLRREISNKLSQINPHVPHQNYKIKNHNIYNSIYEKIEGLFIVEVIVIPTDSQFFYATAKDEVYMKTDGGKKKMKMQELQIEIRDRNNTQKNYV